MLPLLAVTARTDPDLQQQVEAAGIGGFLRKPVTGELLVEAIARVMGSPSAWACGDKVANDPWVSPWKMEYISVLTSPMIDDYATELREASPMADGRLSLPQIRLSRSNSARKTGPVNVSAARSCGGAGNLLAGIRKRAAW
ncbi:hypothetical protein G6F32_015222 [Rhizopus arrhizus]|nr:hypothetical protein G6F32_015222 [Rhizopus arrhizus]